ncbi:MAG: hypothetical protein U1F54_16665 [Burkholderiales bacterium]
MLDFVSDKSKGSLRYATEELARRGAMKLGPGYVATVNGLPVVAQFPGHTESYEDWCARHGGEPIPLELRTGALLCDYDREFARGGEVWVEVNGEFVAVGKYKKPSGPSV